jgi:hypothetical protein
MAYVALDTILDDEYIAFANSSSSPYGYNHFAGTGSGVYGLGQTALSLVAAGDVVQAAQWNSLFTAMDNIANHTNDTLTSTTAVSAGDVIQIKSALIADLATLAASVAAGSPNATALTASTALQTVTTASEGWDSTANQEVSITWSTADAMRFYFNQGGKVRITVGTTQGSINPKDQAFIDLGTAIGNLDIAAQATTRSGTGETLTTNGLAIGFHDLTTSYQTILTLTSDNSNYTSNSVRIQAKLNAAVGTAVTMTIQMTATDSAADDQYTSPNTSSVPAAVKDTPKMVTTLFAIRPTTAQGLATVYNEASTATVSNTVT